jgi:hypothetical protein
VSALAAEGRFSFASSLLSIFHQAHFVVPQTLNFFGAGFSPKELPSAACLSALIQRNNDAATLNT